MAKLSEVMTKKGSGKLLTRELTGKACLITEDIIESTDIRETEDGKYLCIQIKIDGEIRDWNPTAPQLRSVVEAVGKPPNLKGKAFQITGSVKDGYKSKTVAVELRGDYVPEHQQRITDPMPTGVVAQPAQPAQQGGNDLAVFLDTINAQPGQHITGDDALQALALLISGNEVTKANFLLGVAKFSGKIRNVGGCWKVTS